MTRTWTKPNSPWIMQQNWMEAFFLNAPCDKAHLSSFLPKGLELDLFQGQTWVSIIPFKMENVRFRFSPFSFHHFPEVNIRTYVTFDNKPGVLFLSLESPHRIFNSLVRSLIDIPYIDSYVNYESSSSGSRVNVESNNLKLNLKVKNLNDPVENESGSFEHWISERYCFYNIHRGRLTRWEIDHEPWVLKKAKLEDFEYKSRLLNLDSNLFFENTLYSPGVKTKAWYGEKAL